MEESIASSFDKVRIFRVGEGYWIRLKEFSIDSIHSTARINSKIHLIQI